MTNRKAIYFMLVSTASFAVLNALAKYLTDYHVFEIVFFRSVGSVAMGLPFLLKNKIPILGTHQKLLFARGIMGVSSMALFFFSLKLLPLGTAVSLRYLSPIFAGVFAVWLLHERIKPIQWFYFLIAFIGVLMLKGFETNVNVLGLVYILLAALFSGLVYIIIRKIGTREHPVVVVNYFMIIATVAGGILMIPFWKTPAGKDWLLLLSLGVFGFFGQLFMTKAFQIETASRMAPFKYTEAIFALMVGWLWFGESYTIFGFVGIGLIMAGMFLNVMVKKE